MSSRPTGGLLGRLTAGAQTISTRRLFIFLSGILLLSTTLILFTSADITATTEELKSVKLLVPDSVTRLKDKIPSVGNYLQFGPPTHKPPPPAKNSTSSTDSWYSTLKWMTRPFSSSIAHGEERVALPQVEERCSIFTYHNVVQGGKKEAAEIADKMLLAWRRVWWAHGFNPVILGVGEAKNHPLYKDVQGNRLSDELKGQLVKLMAWAQMGAGATDTHAGIFIDYRVLPMAPRDDDFMVELRKCDFKKMSRYTDLEQRLYTSDKDSLDNLLRRIMSHPPKKDTKTIEEAISSGTEKPDDHIHVHSHPAALADYTPAVVKEKFPSLKPSDLPDLVNSHLHSQFLSEYSEGITVLAPVPNKLSPMHHNALALANRIAACPVNNPLPTSCPPNIAKCTVCKKGKEVTAKPEFMNSTKTFLLGTVPHPYTFLALTDDSVHVDTDPDTHLNRYVRRKTVRNPWVKNVTNHLIKVGFSEAPRLRAMKGTVARRHSSKFTSLWSTDVTSFKDTEWLLGFVVPTAEEIRLELKESQMKKVLETVKKILNKGEKKTVRGAVEGWHLADTELWKFVNAWVKRQEMVRVQWTEREKKFRQGLAKEER